VAHESGALGGNSFDVLNLVVADISYRKGSLFHAAGSDDLFLALSAGFMTTVLLAGMLRRELRGPAKIGFESFLVLAVYVSTLLVIAISD
jgi:cation:H+ antiporter